MIRGWWQTGSSDKKVMLIRLASYNIRNGRNDVLESALHGMDQSNMYLDVLQYTKVVGGVYKLVLEGYTDIFANALIRRQGGLEVLYINSLISQVGYHQTFEPIVSIFRMVSGGCRWYVVS